MPKMTRWQAIHRLREAQTKIGNVWLTRAGGTISPAHAGKLSAMVRELDAIMKKLKSP